VVSRLEKKLGARLLQRSTPSLAVTEVGRELYERAVGILSALDETEAMIQRTHAERQGVLKLTCGVEFGLLVVNPWIRTYLERYPDQKPIGAGGKGMAKSIRRDAAISKSTRQRAVTFRQRSSEISPDQMLIQNEGVARD
jgi:DNA-binding transcriptional LysR family regulator